MHRADKSDPWIAGKSIQSVPRVGALLSSHFIDEKSEVQGDEVIHPRLESFVLGHLDFRVLASRTYKNKCWLFSASQFVALFYGSYRKLSWGRVAGGG